MSSLFCRSEVCISLDSASALGFTGPASRCRQTCFFLEALWGECTSRLIQMLAETSSMWLWAPGPCRLGLSHPQLLEGSPVPRLLGPSLSPAGCFSTPDPLPRLCYPFWRASRGASLSSPSCLPRSPHMMT